MLAAIFDSRNEVDVAAPHVIEFHMQELVVARVECIYSGSIRFLKAIITPVLSSVSGMSNRGEN